MLSLKADGHAFEVAIFFFDFLPVSINIPFIHAIIPYVGILKYVELKYRAFGHWLSMTLWIWVCLLLSATGVLWTCSGVMERPRRPGMLWEIKWVPTHRLCSVVSTSSCPDTWSSHFLLGSSKTRKRLERNERISRSSLLRPQYGFAFSLVPLVQYCKSSLR